MSDNAPMIEAVYISHGVYHADEHDTVDEAVEALVGGSEMNALSPYGVVIDGKAHCTVHWDGARLVIDEHDARELMEAHALVHANRDRSTP